MASSYNAPKRGILIHVEGTLPQVISPFKCSFRRRSPSAAYELTSAAAPDRHIKNEGHPPASQSGKAIRH
jgi:hypothetical protein